MSKSYGFVDFWSVTLQHVDVILACIFMCMLFDIFKQVKLVIVMSDKVTTLLEAERFCMTQEDFDSDIETKEGDESWEAQIGGTYILRSGQVLVVSAGYLTRRGVF